MSWSGAGLLSLFEILCKRRLRWIGALCTGWMTLGYQKEFCTESYLWALVLLVGQSFTTRMSVIRRLENKHWHEKMGGDWDYKIRWRSTVRDGMKRYEGQRKINANVETNERKRENMASSHVSTVEDYVAMRGCQARMDIWRFYLYFWTQLRLLSTGKCGSLLTKAIWSTTVKRLSWIYFWSLMSFWGLQITLQSVFECFFSVTQGCYREE